MRERDTLGEMPEFERLRAELRQAFAASDTSYLPLTAAQVIQRNSTPSATRE